MTDEPAICSKCKRQPIEGCVEGYIRTNDLHCPEHQGKRSEDYCEQCQGTGWLLVKKKQCRNMFASQLRTFLGPELAAVKHVKQSPLLTLGGTGEPPVVDLTGGNVFIQDCPWHNLKPHLKWVLTYKKSRDTNYLFRIETDERIKNVFVGNENFVRRSGSIRETPVNSVGDLVGGDYQLVIIRLGFLGYKNVAASGALKEALMIRENLGKPTWLIEDPIRGWSHSNGIDVLHYIERMFTGVSIESSADPGVDDITDADLLGIGTDDDDEEGETPGLRLVQMASPTFDDEQPVVDDDDIDMGPLGGS